MITKDAKPKMKRTPEAMVNLPLSSLRYLSSSANKKKVVIEILVDDLRRVNTASTLDEILSEARLDYATGNYSSHKSAKSLIAALES